MRLRGQIISGLQHFTVRMTQFPEVFRDAAGCRLYPGTINVQVDEPIAIVEAFRIPGALIGEPEQDLLFEPCRITVGMACRDGFRIRPYQPVTGAGGHGDDILEISCAQKIPGVTAGCIAEVEFFRD